MLYAYRSISASTKDDLSSESVDPPIIAHMKHPSGLRTLYYILYFVNLQNNLVQKMAPKK